MQRFLVIDYDSLYSLGKLLVCTLVRLANYYIILTGGTPKKAMCTPLKRLRWERLWENGIAHISSGTQDLLVVADIGNTRMARIGFDSLGLVYKMGYR